jgi:hypothetical protein
VSGYLRVLGAVVLALGITTGVVTGVLFATDSRFQEAATAYERHPDHPLFEADYWKAAGRHYGLLAASAGGLLGGLVFGATLLGLATVISRLPRR